jgi:serpin B
MESLGYFEGDGFQAVELPYDGSELSMLILLPRSGQFKPFESSLNARLLDTVTAGLARKQVALTMPGFEFNSGFSLKKELARLGMPAAFSMEADFSGMSEQGDLFISDVIHKAFISLNETGTEAAAATAVVMSAKAGPVRPVEVTADRPFVFVIRDIKTATLLFAGRVLDPRR